MCRSAPAHVTRRASSAAFDPCVRDIAGRGVGRVAGARMFARACVCGVTLLDTVFNAASTVVGDKNALGYSGLAFV